MASGRAAAAAARVRGVALGGGEARHGRGRQHLGRPLRVHRELPAALVRAPNRLEEHRVVCVPERNEVLSACVVAL